MNPSNLSRDSEEQNDSGSEGIPDMTDYELLFPNTSYYDYDHCQYPYHGGAGRMFNSTTPCFSQPPLPQCIMLAFIHHLLNRQQIILPPVLFMKWRWVSVTEYGER